MTESVNESINDGGDCRTAPATPGLLKIIAKYYLCRRAKIHFAKIYFTNRKKGPTSNISLTDPV